MWNRESIREFWESNKASFSGDIKAPEVIRLTSRYVRGAVLDAGAGSGTLMKILAQQNIDVTGIDIAPKGPGIVKADIDSLPFADRTFSTVFALDILEHLPPMTLKMGLSEIYRVLLPNGTLIATVPNREDLEESTVWCPSCHNRFHRWGHINRFDSNNLKDLLGEFVIVSARSLPLALMAEYSLFRYFWPLFRKMGLSKNDELLVVARK